MVYDTDSQGVFLRDSLSFFLQDTFSNEPGTRPNLDPEYFHAFRVSLRRCRAVLATFKKLVEPSKFDYFQTDWRWLMQAIGEVWNLDVFHAKLAEFIPPALAESHRVAYEAFTRELHDAQREPDTTSPRDPSARRRYWRSTRHSPGSAPSCWSSLKTSMTRTCIDYASSSRNYDT